MSLYLNLTQFPVRFSLIKLGSASSSCDISIDNNLLLRLYFLWKQNLDLYSCNWYWSTYIDSIVVVNNLRLCCQIMYTSIVTMYESDHYLHVCMTRNCTVYVIKIYVQLTSIKYMFCSVLFCINILTQKSYFLPYLFLDYEHASFWTKSLFSNAVLFVLKDILIINMYNPYLIFTLNNVQIKGL